MFIVVLVRGWWNSVPLPVSLPRPLGYRSLGREILRLMIAQTAPLKQKTSVYELFPIIAC